MSTSTITPEPAAGVSLLADAYHLAMAGYYTFRLLLDNKAVTNTYGYNKHLEQVSFVDRRFRRWLAENPAAVAALKRPVQLIDWEPDTGKLASYAEGSLGREYHRVVLRYRSGELDYLRPLRLRTLPHEEFGLERSPADTATGEELYRWLVARRNIYMTTSHDLAHLLAGCDVSLQGEALVAMYQFWHLRVPQNFMNLWNARLALSAGGNFAQTRRIRAAWRVVMASANPLEVDWESLWAVPLPEARAAVGLPPEGLQQAEL